MNKYDVVKVKLNTEELKKIRKYCDMVFPKDKVMKMDSQWSSKSTRNPNETGIIGEWVYYKVYSKVGISLDDYLKQRPVYVSDTGDGILDNGNVVDIKTRYFKEPIEKMWGSEFYTARVEEKHIDKHFIDIFTFVHVCPEMEMAYILGWMERDEFFVKSRLVKNKGIDNGRPDTNWYEIKYRDLYAMAGLDSNKICMSEQ